MKILETSIAALVFGAISVGAQAADCTGLPEWDSSTAYFGGAKVQEANKAYTANWWSYGYSPASYSGQWQEWTLDGECEGANHAPVAVITYSQSSSSNSSSVTLTGEQSTDPDGDALTYSWDGINFSDVTTKTVKLGGWYDNCFDVYDTFTLTVKDIHGAIGTAQEKILIARASYGNPYCSSSSVSSTGNVCESAQFVSGTNYSVDQLAQNGGNEYQCVVPGWCSSTADWAYAPGTGDYWDQAWALVRSCSAGTSSSSSSISNSSSSVASTSASSSSTSSSSTSSITGF